MGPRSSEASEDDSSREGSFFNDSSSNGKSVAVSSSSTASPTRNRKGREIQEVIRMSAKDTRRIRISRMVATSVLLITAVAVTLTTYKFLTNDETNNFETAFDQFSRTVADAALQQQMKIREAVKTFSDIASSASSTEGANWPMYTLPHFELHAANARLQSGAEMLSVINVVRHDERAAYEQYVTDNYMSWMNESHMIEFGNFDNLNATGYRPFISTAGPGGFTPDMDRDYYCPSWTFSPPPRSYSSINWNLRNAPDYDSIFQASFTLKNETLVTRVRPYAVAVGSAMTPGQHAAMHGKALRSGTEHPHSFVYTPIHREVNNYESDIVAFVGAAIAWDFSLLNLLPSGVNGIMAIIKNNCGQTYTYRIDGRTATYFGEGDMHESKYDNMGKFVDLALYTNPNFKATPGHCQYSMYIYPSTSFQSEYNTNTPKVYASVVAFTFVLVAVAFVIYDILVQRRNNKMIVTAAKSNAILSSMFPDKIRDRLMAQNDEDVQKKTGTKHLKRFLTEEGGKLSGDMVDLRSKPLADLFLETTVLFADVVGFTAWSSVREPSQVFTLLESLYSSFDEIAKRRNIFKVETVGDCYVAVSGLPDPQKDHALAMARFARDIMHKMNQKTKELEITLGPDTGDLSLRIGIHSGAVTGGVLRGERSRFQLFGDTMNTTARLESSGERGKIHVSEETAALLTQCGKGNWLVKRQDIVTAKGKGALETYWLTLGTDTRTFETSSVCDDKSSMDVPDFKLETMETKHVRTAVDRNSRLIDWNVETLLRLLKQIVARGEAESCVRENRKRQDDVNDDVLRKDVQFLEEVKEIIVLPEFDQKVAQKQCNPDTIKIPETAVAQLRTYVACIASMYRDNPFHNFDHASHVIMSVVKLMSRIVAPAEMASGDDEGEHAMLHDHTYGITSDPLTQFACAFSALIHDVDHTGVPNAQLVKEEMTIAVKYKYRSVAEQNSLFLSLELLMEPRFSELRALIYSNDTELRRFRQLVINAVMSTDIVDKDLKALRNARWSKAFDTETTLAVSTDSRADINRKATIVIEHLIQASDVSHTMQHWHVYRKWNEKFFMECYQAWLAGRAEVDPSDSWYKGEIGFFDFYIIPLARKLKDCGVFGKSSDEYLSYALQNRQEWENRGQQVVAEMIEKVKRSTAREA